MSLIAPRAAEMGFVVEREETAVGDVEVRYDCVRRRAWRGQEESSRADAGSRGPHLAAACIPRVSHAICISADNPPNGRETSDNVYVKPTALSTNRATFSSSPGHAALPPHHTLTRCTLVTCWSMMVHDPRKGSASSASASCAFASWPGECSRDVAGGVFTLSNGGCHFRDPGYSGHARPRGAPRSSLMYSTEKGGGGPEAVIV